jgi:hypothetical protein
MKHMRALNKKAGRIDDYVASRTEDVVGHAGPPVRPAAPPRSDGLRIDVHARLGSGRGRRNGGLCQPVERDIYDCFVSCYWPAQVPDHLNNAPDWTAKCATATKDWRNLDLVFP